MGISVILLMLLIIFGVRIKKGKLWYKDKNYSVNLSKSDLYLG
jgi:hypothetical protein